MKIKLARSTLVLKSVLLLGFLLVATVSVGQDLRFQVWTDFNARFEVLKKLQVNAETGYRIEPESGVQNGYLRGTLRYSPNRIIALDLGLANFNVWDPDIINSFEFRTFQFVLLNWPEIWEFNFKIRLGIEQRWFSFREIDTNEFVHRARLRISLNSPYFGFWQGPSKLYLTTNFEVLRDLNDELLNTFVDEDRFMLGVGFLDNKNFRGELHYQIMSYLDRDVQVLVRKMNLVRIRFYYYFSKRSG